MPTATQNQDGTWTINGLKWVKETGKPIPDDLVFTGTISYNNKDAVQVNVEKNGTNYQTDWKTMLGSKLDVNLLVLQCGDVTRNIGDKWYTYKAKSNFTTEDIHPFEVELNATCTNTTPGSDGDSATLNITANTSWSVECDDWITISPTEGTSGVTQAQVTYVENTGTDTRTGRISVYAGDKYVDISIEQSGFVPEISITAPATIDAAATGISYTATSNVDDVIVELSDGQRKTNKIGSFTIPENTSSDQVTYTLTAFCTNYTTYVATTTVIQNGIELLTPEVKSFDISTTDIEKQGGKIKLTAETLPTGHTISVENLPSWITVDPSSTEQNWVGKVSENEDVNERSYVLTGTVTTNTDQEYEGTTSLTKTWTITQAGNTQQDLSVSPTSLAYVSTGGVSTLTISNPDGYRWTITGQPEWISLSTTAGTGDANISVTAQENPRTTNRDGQLVVNDIDNDKHITVSLEQEGTGELPIYCDFEFKYNTAVTVTNMTRSMITFEDTSSQAFKMDVGTADIGTGFDGEVAGADAGVPVVTGIGIGSETQGNLNVERQDEIANVGLSYSFEGSKDESQKVTVNLIFTNKTDPSKGTKTSGDIVDGASPAQINFYDWFNSNGRVDVDVNFEIKVRYP